jgi:hypothetical protein
MLVLPFSNIGGLSISVGEFVLDAADSKLVLIAQSVHNK